MQINPNNTWRLVEERIAQESDPIIKRNLELVRNHMKSEAQMDIEGVVATLCDSPRYVMHDNPDDARTNPSGDKDAVRQFYDSTIVQTGAHQLEHAVDRVVADQHAVMTEGTLKMAYPGKTLVAMGIEVDDPDAYYAMITRMNVVWPVDPESGLLTGEEVYSCAGGFDGIADRKLGPDAILPIS